jgi:ubiquinone/menaquinone biosynthesis C-methylase UbiE
MIQFGKNLLLRVPFSFFQKIFFLLFGQNFIGAAIRYAHFKRALKKFSSFGSEQMTILDAGCGTGDFGFYVAERFPQHIVQAYDIVHSTLQTNRELAEKTEITNITFTKQDLLLLDQKDTYHFVFCIGTLIYFSKEETRKILQNLVASLKEGGYLYIDLPQEDFLEVNWIPTKCYPNYYAALKKENSGYLYSLDDMIKLLSDLGLDVVWKNKSFGYLGKFAWEFDNVLREKNWTTVRLFFVPFLKVLTWADARIPNIKGCCFVILVQKISQTTKDGAN